MVYCTHCADDCPFIKDPDKGYICCGTCGKVLDQDIYTDQPEFIKDASGTSRMSGNILNSIESGSSLSHERTLMKGRDEIWQIVTSLHVGGGETIIDMAHKFYTLAVDNNFTRGRRTTHVAAACLYIACRQSKKAYLLIDFSDYLKISVYVLGAVFLQLCQVLLLAEHPIVQKLIDPSLFIHRFTERLLGKRDNAVSDTALRIVASMKRDWMQTGRKPSGLCGAALYIAALSHGYNYTKSNIVAVVHVCEATLTKRLIEFENTESGSLTIEDFLAKADEEEPVLEFSPKSGEVLCKHKDKGVEHFAHGLCEKCYNKFTKLSGGLEGGADPPAFQRAEKLRLEAAKKAEEAAAMNAETVCEIEISDAEHNIMSPMKNSVGDKSSTVSSEDIAKNHVASEDAEVGGENGKADADPENFSDIDDVEVDGYLHNEEETQYKKIIWEEMNKEYLEEQAAKEALAAELAARGVRVGEGQQKKRRRNEDTKTPAETPAEATYNMLKRKGLGSKINVDAVGGLYNTKDEDSEANEKGDMGFDGEYAHDTGDGETFEGDYADYNKDGYADGGDAGPDNDFEELDFEEFDF
ncbi:transcription factor IIIB 60 kDa subunit-like [Lolium rigidum]|uniref:transcription factor IIIB 60 kDa subunit-like n=1 Tax=Lolium rigidum TaxID=89674 RepID=UPI001F5D7967|nr:transcription factor IIIB 60 kDa subunit-like [Lolium rigidum]XP_047081840.1 transcription factor IIIB 60 kDa subunit-like [Lolium rigidum]